jgi:Ni/Co efflux regulator RcnB
MKKPKGIRVIQEIDGTDIPLKVWNRQNLRREDWDFLGLQDFPQEMLRVAWLYEADRELGSDNRSYFEAWELQELKKRKAKLEAHLKSENCLSDDCLSESALLALLPEIPPDQKEQESKAALEKMLKPDMTLAESDAYREKEWAHDTARARKLNAIARAEVKAKTTTWRPPSPKEPERVLKSYHHHEFAKMKVPMYYTWVDGRASPHSTIHPLEIDWTLTETELVEAFRNWLRKGDHAPLHPSWKRTAKSKVGKRKTEGWLAWLGELAIYRISEAGFTRKEGLVELGNNHKSAANWEHAQARTLDRIEKRKERCEHSAWDQGAGSPENWRDWFVKPFGL